MLVGSKIVKPSGVSSTGNFPVTDLASRGFFFSSSAVSPFFFFPPSAAAPLPLAEKDSLMLTSVYSMSRSLAVIFTRLAPRFSPYPPVVYNFY